MNMCIDEYLVDIFSMVTMFKLEKYVQLTTDPEYQTDLDPYQEFETCRIPCKDNINCIIACKEKLYKRLNDEV